MTSTRNFAQNLAVKTGELLSSYFKLSGIDPNVKADNTVVTEADMAADELIRKEIRAAYPDDEILTEETNGIEIDPAKPLWVIDPLDGTTNFSLGLHTWGVSIVRLIDGYPDTGALFFPQLDELYSAQQGEGAYLNDQRFSVQPLRPGMPTAFFTTCSTSARKYELNIRYKFRILGAVAYDFCLVARGASLLSFHAIPKIWDIAAGWLVLEEAGGYASCHPEGSPFPYFANQQAPETSYPVLLAATPQIADQASPNIRRK
jgi:myo-inositol-1(or 4)-monophosphatase